MSQSHLPMLRCYVVTILPVGPVGSFAASHLLLQVHAALMLFFSQLDLMSTSAELSASAAVALLLFLEFAV